jgi:hypothetical protein
VRGPGSKAIRMNGTASTHQEIGAYRGTTDKSRSPAKDTRSDSGRWLGSLPGVEPLRPERTRRMRWMALAMVPLIALVNEVTPGTSI